MGKKQADAMFEEKKKKRSATAGLLSVLIKGEGVSLAKQFWSLRKGGIC